MSHVTGACSKIFGKYFCYTGKYGHFSNQHIIPGETLKFVSCLKAIKENNVYLRYLLFCKCGNHVF